MAIQRHPHDPLPEFLGAVVRTWSHRFGSDEDWYATAWDAKREEFVEVLFASTRFDARAIVTKDATPDILSRWHALPIEKTSIVPPGARLPLMGRFVRRTSSTTFWVAPR